MRQRTLRRRFASVAGAALYPRPGWCLAVFISLAWAAACPAAPSPAAKPRRAPGTGPETAQVYDDGYRLPAKDLLLNLDGERKAEALARFINGVLLDTAGEDRAVAQYLRSLSLDPSNGELSAKLARVYLDRGDAPAAINLLKDTIKAAPRQAQAYLALAYVYYMGQHKTEQALKYAQQGQELDPVNALAYEYLATLYRVAGQPQKIGPLLDRAAKAESRNPLYWLQLGKLYIETYLMADPAKPGEELRKTTAIFQKALAVGGNDAEMVDKVADFLTATRQIKEAIPLYERAIELDPGQLSPRENLAQAYLATEQPAKAAEALEGVIKVNPAEPRAYEALAKIYQDAGDLGKAAANYGQAMLVNPSNYYNYENAAKLLIKNRQAEKAVPILAEARRRFPELPGFTYLHALALSFAKQPQQAVAVFEQAEMEAQNRQPELLNAQFYGDFGAAADAAGLVDRAVQLMKKSLALASDSATIAQTSNGLGYLWVDHNLNLEEGGELIKRALELEPDNGAFLDSLGWYYYRTNQFDQAILQLKRAVEMTKPEDATVYEHLGDSYFKVNDTAKAVDCWQHAVDLDPANPNLPELSKKLADTKAAAPAPAVLSPTPKN